MKKFMILIFIVASVITISAQSVNVVFKSGKVVMGEVVQEEANYLVIVNDTGELKIDRQNIESISYKSKEKQNVIPSNDNTSNSYYDKIVLDDMVVIYLKEDEIVSGTLIAKGLDVVIINTKDGMLTIPKRQIDKIEYLSGEFAERGEVVVAYLANGTKFEGNIYFEDFKSLILDTKIGRLTIDKENLRTLEYTDQRGKGDESLLTKYATISGKIPIIEKRLDVLSLSYSPSFGANYSSGFGLGYASKFLLSQSENYYLSAIGGLSFKYFMLNKDNFNDVTPAVSASGGTLITTISAGVAITLLQDAESKFEFYIAPQLEANIIYSTLEQEFPSFPSFNSKVTETTFAFGVGNKLGFDIKFDNYRLGASFNSHFLFGSEDYNSFAINFSQKLF